MKRVLLAFLLAAVLFASSVAQAGGGGYALDWWTIDGGGGRLSTGDYRLNSTIGQFDAAHSLQAGDYHLEGGFWPGIPRMPIYLYLPLINAP